ncbi:hypothetical protein KAW48_02015 [candidate division WOR-3 bacterium]|nr:hypothetical protein [candidate division WOR-3 bacterium]
MVYLYNYPLPSHGRRGITNYKVGHYTQFHIYEQVRRYLPFGSISEALRIYIPVGEP